MYRCQISSLWCLLVLLGAPLAGQNPENRFDLGVRFDAVGATGVPSNDILGVGLFGHHWLSERWGIGLAVDHSDGFDVAARADQHLTDWTVTDRVSGRTTSLDDYTVRGAHVGFMYRF